jgi:hypothetical protein
MCRKWDKLGQNGKHREKLGQIGEKWAVLGNAGNRAGRGLASCDSKPAREDKQRWASRRRREVIGTAVASSCHAKQALPAAQSTVSRSRASARRRRGSGLRRAAAADGQRNGGGGVDRFRLKIWDRATGVVVYDNQLGAPDDADPSTAIGGGSIVIHPN